jgi:sugar lactone lactonase YvrE
VQLPDIAATVQASMPVGAAPPAPESASPGVTTLFQLSIPGSAPGQLDDPRGVAVGPDGAIYVAGYGDGRVQRFSPQGSFERGWRVEDDRPILAIVAGRDGRIYVSQVPGVSVYDGASGALLDVIAPGEGFQDLALLADGSLLGIPWAGTDLVRLDPDGREIDRIVDPLGAVSPGDRPDALAVDRDGTIYLIAAFSSEIFVFDAQGAPLGTIQTPDRGGSPSLAVDAAGRIYLNSILDGLLILNREGALVGTIDVPGYPFDFTFDAEGALYAVTNAPSILKLRVAAQ